MIFDVDQAKELILSNKETTTKILDARKYYKKCRALIKGKDFKDLLTQIAGIESDSKIEIRKKYARSIKDVNKRLLNEIDKIYSATGTNKHYNIKEAVSIPFYKTIANIADNKTLEKWLQLNWCKDLYHVDPNGLIFLEYKTSPYIKIYPTYKSITSIRNYKINGQNIEWVLFEPEQLPNGMTKWRLVDDKMDYTFIGSGPSLILSEEKTFAHPFGQVPAIVNSDIEDIETGMRLSPFDDIFEIQEELLRDLSIKNLYKNRHGFPIFWRYKMLCPHCHGTGKNGIDVCKICNGVGEVRTKDVSDEISLGIPNENQPKLAPDLAGYILPPKETWDQYNQEIQMLEDLCRTTIWGISQEEKNNETATAKYIDTQFRIDKYNLYADTGEWVEWQLSEWLVNFYDPTKNKKERSVSINYGRRYILESADELIAKYKESVEKGLTTIISDEYLTEHLTVKYKNNPEGLMLALKRKNIEPYIHYTIEQVNNYYGPYEAKRKGIFNDWWEEIEEDVKKQKTDDQLKTDFDIWCIDTIGEPASEETTLAESIGVGGTQSFQSILTDPNLSEDQKKGSLKVLFNLSDEQISTIFNN